MENIDKEGIKIIEETKTDFICLTFCDVFGNEKNITILPEELQRAFDTGIPIDASQVRGFKTDDKIDLLVIPSAATLSVIPESVTHQGSDRIMRMFCNIYYPDGRPFENDARALLERTVKEAEAEGYRFNIGPAMEFYLFSTESGTPYDNAGYMDCFPLDRCEEIRRKICTALEKMNIHPEVAYHEAGPGQNKIKFHFSDPVKAADDVIGYRSVVKTIASDNNLYADFSPKPIEKEQGNSLHVNMSVIASDRQDRLPHMIAGILNLIPEMTLFLNPDRRSYKRLGHENAPKYISWSEANRSTLIRIPAYGGSNRFELRSPDNLTNPYIAFTLLIKACMEGIHKTPVLQKATDIDLFDTAEKSLPKLKVLPLTIQEARNKAQNSGFIKGILPKSIIDLYIED